MTVSKRTRYEVLKRDNHACRYCGIAAPEVVLTVDHVMPKSLGGSDDPSNLVAACRACNSGKSSTSPSDPVVADVEQKALEWGRAIETYNQIRLGDRRKRNAYVRRFEKKWEQWHYGYESKSLPLPGDWRLSIWQFYGAGLPIAELEDAVDIACGNRAVAVDSVWRYMCGVVWRKVQDMQDGAAAILEKESTDGP